MGRDESGTLSALKSLRREVIDPAIAERGSRIVRTTGAGLLLEFPSVVDAVRCAVEVQKAMAAATADVAEDRRIALRVGINLGDIIIIDGDDIFGDGVNIAARLEALADPGGICLSDDAWRQVRGKIELACQDHGLQTLKKNRRARPRLALVARRCSCTACAAPAEQTVDRGPAVPEHQWRSRAGVFRGWDG